MVCLSWAGCQAQTSKRTQMKQISVGGMQVFWHFEGDLLIIDATAPDRGWVAIGFNSSDDIVHTNLIMAGTADGKPYVSDRYVFGLGNHQSVESVGGSTAVNLLSASSNGNQTQIRFSISVQPTDRYHYALTPGTTLFLICAFSTEDDISHHSRMRQHVRVVL
jgi:DOMON domain